MEYASGIAGRARAMLLEAQKGNPKAKVAVTRKHFPGTKEISLASAVAGGRDDSSHRVVGLGVDL